MNQIEVRRRHATSGLTIRGAKLFFKKVHTLRGWDRREARLRLFGNPKHITPKFASCATSITWRATRPWARQSGARSYAIVDICICRETGERGANPILSKRGKLRTPCGDSWIAAKEPPNERLFPAIGTTRTALCLVPFPVPNGTVCIVPRSAFVRLERDAQG